MATFGERLRELRKEKGMTIQGLADYLEVSRRTITFYETDEREPGHAALTKLCALFECSADYILGISDDRYGGDPSKLNKIGIIEAYNKLSKDKQRIIDDIVGTLLKSENTKDSP